MIERWTNVSKQILKKEKKEKEETYLKGKKK